MTHLETYQTTTNAQHATAFHRNIKRTLIDLRGLVDDLIHNAEVNDKAYQENLDRAKLTQAYQQLQSMLIGMMRDRNC